MIGTIVNTICILVGSFVGSALKKGIKEEYQSALFTASYEEYISKFFVKIGIFKLSTVGKIFQLLSF